MAVILSIARYGDSLKEGFGVAASTGKWLYGKYGLLKRFFGRATDSMVSPTPWSSSTQCNSLECIYKVGPEKYVTPIALLKIMKAPH